MRSGEDVHAARRLDLLAPVARWCVEAGLAVRAEAFRSRTGPTVQALLCSATDGSWEAAVTVVRAHRLPLRPGDETAGYTRDPRNGYDLDSTGELVYEVQISEDDDGGSPHGPRPVVLFRLVADAQAAADELVLWSSLPALYRTPTPVPDDTVRRRREQRVFNRRQEAAAAPRLRVESVPREAAADVAAIDDGSLAWHFPRDRMGRPLRSAVVALRRYGGRPTSRALWLIARADGDDVVVGTSELVGASQRHRWDLAPWLWDRRRARTATVDRWQVARPADAAVIAEAVRLGALRDALDLAGVRTDREVSRLLDGAPTRGFRAGNTEGWVARLYGGLADAAPWRFATALNTWRDHLREAGSRVTGPVPLFGLGGLNQARRPKIGLDEVDGRPRLRMIFTASATILPVTLWTVPDDLAANLRGWQPVLTPRRNRTEDRGDRA